MTPLMQAGPGGPTVAVHDAGTPAVPLTRCQTYATAALSVNQRTALRDEFAKAALTGLLVPAAGGLIDFASFGTAAYALADAMLAARDDQPEVKL